MYWLKTDQHYVVPCTHPCVAVIDFEMSNMPGELGNNFYYEMVRDNGNNDRNGAIYDQHYLLNMLRTQVLNINGSGLRQQQKSSKPRALLFQQFLSFVESNIPATYLGEKNTFVRDHRLTTGFVPDITDLDLMMMSPYFHSMNSVSVMKKHNYHVSAMFTTHLSQKDIEAVRVCSLQRKPAAD